MEEKKTEIGIRGRSKRREDIHHHLSRSSLDSTYLCSYLSHSKPILQFFPPLNHTCPVDILPQYNNNYNTDIHLCTCLSILYLTTFRSHIYRNITTPAVKYIFLTITLLKQCMCGWLCCNNSVVVMEWWFAHEAIKSFASV